MPSLLAHVGRGPAEIDCVPMHDGANGFWATAIAPSNETGCIMISTAPTFICRLKRIFLRPGLTSRPCRPAAAHLFCSGFSGSTSRSHGPASTLAAERCSIDYRQSGGKIWFWLKALRPIRLLGLFRPAHILYSIERICSSTSEVVAVEQ